MTTTLFQNILMEFTSCCSCDVRFAVPKTLLDHRRQHTNASFYCPNGHSLSYTTSAATRLQKELDQARLELSRQNTARAIAEGKLRLIEKEKRKETCFVCGRKYIHLAKHLKNRHGNQKQ